MLAALVFTGAVVCLANLLGLALFVKLMQRRMRSQEEALAAERRERENDRREFRETYAEWRDADGPEQDELEEAGLGPLGEARWPEPRFQTVFSTAPSVQAVAASLAGTAAQPAISRPPGAAAGAGAAGAAAAPALGSPAGNASPATGMTTSKRVQILQLHRRGVRPAQIAADLGLPKAEVDLVIKLHAASAAP